MKLALRRWGRSFVRGWKRLPHPLRWFVVGVVGLTSIVVGLIFMVLPGPGIPFVIAGLAILATEFTWAELLLHHVKMHSENLRDEVVRRLRRRRHDR